MPFFRHHGVAALTSGGTLATQSPRKAPHWRICSIAGAAQHAFFHSRRSSQSTGGVFLNFLVCPQMGGYLGTSRAQAENSQSESFLVYAPPSTSRVRQAGASKLPGGASFNFNARTREDRLGGRARGAGALRDPQKG